MTGSTGNVDKVPQDAMINMYAMETKTVSDPRRVTRYIGPRTTNDRNCGKGIS